MSRRGAPIAGLGTVPPFGACSKRDLGIVARHMELLSVPADTVLTTEGELGDGFFVTLEGQAVVHRQRAALTTLGAGGYFGELALLDPAARDATGGGPVGYRMPALHQPTPRWHPIARVIDGQLEAAEEQNRLLLQARPGSLGRRHGRASRPGLHRAGRPPRGQPGAAGPVAHRPADGRASLGRWSAWAGQVARNRGVAVAILVLADELKATTIDAILAKSDLRPRAPCGSVVALPRGPAVSTQTVGKAFAGRVLSGRELGD
jgi:hypothetical protein